MEDDVVEAGFEKEMYRIYRDAYAKCKYNAHISFNMLEDHGGLVTAKRLLSQHGLQHGFEQLCLCGCPNITMESLILRDPWRHLFTDKEKEVAIARLKTFGYEFDHGEVVE